VLGESARKSLVSGGSPEKVGGIPVRYNSVGVFLQRCGPRKDVRRQLN
jgi:hypothetical protein